MNKEQNIPQGTQGTSDGMPPCNPGEETGMEGELSLALAYVPKQYWRELYGHDAALMHGTMFRELHLPFLGEQMGGTGVHE